MTSTAPLRTTFTTRDASTESTRRTEAKSKRNQSKVKANQSNLTFRLSDSLRFIFFIFIKTHFTTSREFEAPKHRARRIFEVVRVVTHPPLPSPPFSHSPITPPSPLPTPPRCPALACRPHQPPPARSVAEKRKTSYKTARHPLLDLITVPFTLQSSDCRGRECRQL